MSSLGKGRDYNILGKAEVPDILPWPWLKGIIHTVLPSCVQHFIFCTEICLSCIRWSLSSSGKASLFLFCSC